MSAWGDVVELDAARPPLARRRAQARREARAAVDPEACSERVAMNLVGSILASLRPKRRRKAVAWLLARARVIAADSRREYAPYAWTDREAASAVVIAKAARRMCAPRPTPPNPDLEARS